MRDKGKDIRPPLHLADLTPGDMLRNNLSGESYIFLGMFHPHPIHGEAMSLVVWFKWLSNNVYVMDALDPAKPLGFTPTEMSKERRRFFLQQALKTYMDKVGR